MKRATAIILTVLFVTLYFGGCAFRIMHWPGGMYLYYGGIFGTVIMLLLLLTQNFGKKEKKDTLDSAFEEEKKK
jgi:hypothetical protein